MGVIGGLQGKRSVHTITLAPSPCNFAKSRTNCNTINFASIK